MKILTKIVIYSCPRSLNIDVDNSEDDNDDDDDEDNDAVFAATEDDNNKSNSIMNCSLLPCKRI